MARSLERSRASVDPEGEFPIDLITYVFHLLAVVSRHRETRLDEMMQPLGLNLSRYRALSVIATFEPCSMSQLADYTAVDRTTLTRTVDHLVRDAMVERATPPTDRRQVLLSLTDRGRAAFRKAIQVIFRSNRQLLSKVGEADQRATARAFEAFLIELIDDQALLNRLLLRNDEG